jgi:hypothetical protein
MPSSAVEITMPKSNVLRFLSTLIAMCLWAAEAGATGPAVTVSPGANPPSTSTNVSGTGFGANEIVDIYFDTTDEELAVTNGSGAFAATPIPIPASALPGLHWITAGGRHSGLGAQTKFSVLTNWAQLGYGSQNKAFNPYENVLSPENVAGLERVWGLTGTLGPVTEYGGKLFVPTAVGNNAAIAALDPASGAMVWSKTVGSINSGRLTEGAGLVLFANGGSVEAISAANGKAAWTANLTQFVVARVVPADGVIYASGASGGLFALNATNGATLWTGTTQTSCQNGPPTVERGFGLDNVYVTCGTTVFKCTFGGAHASVRTDRLRALLDTFSGHVDPDRRPQGCGLPYCPGGESLRQIARRSHRIGKHPRLHTPP